MCNTNTTILQLSRSYGPYQLPPPDVGIVRDPPSQRHHDPRWNVLVGAFCMCLRPSLAADQAQRDARACIFVAVVHCSDAPSALRCSVLALDDSIFSDDANYNKTPPTAPVILTPPLYTSQVLASTDATEVATVVRGLRSMDACLAPWISTQYCWLDFGKTWDMANSAKLQAWCHQNYAANGAVVLLDISIRTLVANESERSRLWWLAVQRSRQATSERDEVMHWRGWDVTVFTPDWQNYKSIRLVDTFDAQNAFGMTYAMNVGSKSNVATLGSHGRLFGGGDCAFRIFRQTIGPIGFVDVKVVTAPRSLVELLLSVKDIYLKYKSFKVDLQFPYVPAAWTTNDSAHRHDQTLAVGGNLLCDNTNTKTPLADGLAVFSGTWACNSILTETIVSGTLPRLLSVLGVNLIGQSELGATADAIRG
ncbi:hypothetical protein AaE_011253 [Aphanomyces astaci]|uniref:Uncharacterized protein n=1 Tax=Aphanomyces astaci TaxID=112090 RepID=A0A6A4ZSI4_APHAT|nr:hypothetical protein AaE_011253 [Aphanomyces astaci]